MRIKTNFYPLKNQCFDFFVSRDFVTIDSKYELFKENSLTLRLEAADRATLIFTMP